MRAKKKVSICVREDRKNTTQTNQPTKQTTKVCVCDYLSMSMIVIIQSFGQYRVLIRHSVLFAFLPVVAGGGATGVRKVFRPHSAT